MALAAKQLERLPTRVWVLCGDSEMAEGSMWEAFEHAAHFELDNLTAIIDVNRLGQRGETMVGWNLDAYVARAEAFGWNAIEVDGHDVEAIDDAFGRAVSTTGRPTVVIARTLKGKGVAAVENQNGLHGKPLEDPDAAIAELGGLRDIRVEVAKPDGRRSALAAPGHRSSFLATSSAPRSRRGRRTATRSRRSEPRGPTSWRSTARSRTRRSPRPSRRHIPSGTSRCTSPSSSWSRPPSGCRRSAGARSLRPSPRSSRARTTSSAWRRSAARPSRSRGSHAGVSIGEDGPSQMALEDIASLRAIHGTTVLHPCDANQTARLVAAMAETDGISYLRTLRPATPVLYRPTRSSRSAAAASSARATRTRSRSSRAGITVHEALKAADALAEEGIAARVIDLYSIKPLDAETLAGRGRGDRRDGS